MIVVVLQMHQAGSKSSNVYHMKNWEVLTELKLTDDGRLTPPTYN